MGVGIGIVVRGAPAGVLVGGRAERSRGWGGMCMLTFANRVSLLRGWPADTAETTTAGAVLNTRVRPTLRPRGCPSAENRNTNGVFFLHAFSGRSHGGRGGAVVAGWPGSGPSAQHLRTCQTGDPIVIGVRDVQTSRA